MKKMMRSEKGFTLIELIIVIAILAIIAAVAIPNILGAVDNSRRSTDVANAKIILNAAAQVNAKNESIVAYQTTYTISAGSITAGNALGNPFAARLLIELNNAGPTPKYKASSAGNFVLTIGANGVMSVSTTLGAVAPTPLTAEYGQQ